ncbi:MAG: ABC transporter ATP-binding protein [Clostridiales Family XIII bacterium]|jgi:ABC-2 type transport system ATP-binding protein|nr:ABC transporter ATP-binding protein [Clostridiales Family XIII bacterium]
MIEFSNVTKNYGKNTAMDNFSIKIDQPGMYCLLGRNGAGKTTLMKLLAGNVAASEGTITVNGEAAGPLAMPESVHFVETGATQFNMRLADLFKAAAEVNLSFDVPFAMGLARRFQLDASKRYKHLSFGMKAMVNTVIAMASGRDILLLDEPVLGFDPVMRKVFYELLSESCAGSTKTVIVSTHIIDEIEKTAERLIIIDRGKKVLFCDMAEIDEKAYCVTGISESVQAATAGLNIISETKAGGFMTRHIYDQRIEASEKYSVSSLGLTDFFVSLVGREQNSGEAM